MIERKHCGKLLPHEAHDWWGLAHLGYGSRTMYWCVGPPVIEGGHWGLREKDER